MAENDGTCSLLLPDGFKPTDSDDESECDSLHIESAQDITLPFSTHLPDFLPSLELDTVTVELGPDECEALIENAFQSTNDLMVTKDLPDGPNTSSLPPVTPKKPQDGASLDPVTPTANLKLLMSAVSPEIRNMEKRQKSKALFNAIVQAASQENIELQQTGDVDCEVDVEGGSQGEEYGEDGEKPASRKSKSLGLLCQRFLSKYPDYPVDGIAMEISLDAVSRELCVERRRIYDIVNVLESVELVQRRAKNKYLWHGKTHINKTLVRLKCLGERNQYADQMEHLKKVQVDREYQQELSNGGGRSKKQPLKDFTNTAGQQDGQLPPGKRLLEDDPNARKDKSLGVMSQKFIMLFLVSKNQLVTLDIAARVLIGDINYEIIENSKFKTKVRRLYDIANILTSLKMIKKVHIHERRGRKPAFRWIGPNPDVSDIDLSQFDLQSKPVFRHSYFHPLAATSTSAPSTATHPSQIKLTPRGKRIASFTRHSSFNIMRKVPKEEGRHCSSAPSSPVKVEDNMAAVSPVTNEKFKREFDTLRTKYPECMSKLFAACNIEKEKMQQQESDQQMLDSTFMCDSDLEVSDQLQTARKVLNLDSEGDRSQSFDSQEALNTLLSETVDSLNVALRDAETMRRSKRTIKQPVKEEYEYQPVVKRSKMDAQAATALQKCNDQNGQKMHITLQRVKTENLTEQVMSELTTKKQNEELPPDLAMLQESVGMTKPAVRVEIRNGSAFVPVQRTIPNQTMENRRVTFKQLPTTSQPPVRKPNLPLIRNPTKTVHIPRDFVKKLLCNETLDVTSEESSKDSMKQVTLDGTTILISTKPVNPAAALPKNKSPQFPTDHSTKQVLENSEAVVQTAPNTVELKTTNNSTDSIQRDLTIVSKELSSGKIITPPDSPPFHLISPDEISGSQSSQTRSSSQTSSPFSPHLQLNQGSSLSTSSSLNRCSSLGSVSELDGSSGSDSQALFPGRSKSLSPKVLVVQNGDEPQSQSQRVTSAPMLPVSYSCLPAGVACPNHISTIPSSCYQASRIATGLAAASVGAPVRLGIPVPVTRVTVAPGPRLALIPSVSTHSTIGQFMPISSVLPPHPGGPVPMRSPLYNQMQTCISTAIPTTNHIPPSVTHHAPAYTSTPAGLITPTTGSQQVINDINFYRTPTTLPLSSVQPKAFLNGQALGVPTPYVLSGIGGSIGQLQPVSRRLTLTLPPFSQT